MAITDVPLVERLRRRPWLGDVALAVLVAVPVGLSSVSLLSDTGAGRRVPLLVVVTVLHACVATRRLIPLGTFAVAALCEGALLAAPFVTVRTSSGPERYSPVLLPSGVVFLIVLYAVAAYSRSERAAWAALGVALAGGVAAGARLAGGTDVVDGAGAVASATAGILAAVAAAWTLGHFRRLQHEQAERARTEQAAAAVRDERARIARDLHDVVSHSLAVIVRQADAGRFVAANDPAAAERVLGTVADTGRAALGDMRSLLGVLRTDGTGDAPTPTSADVEELVERLNASGQNVRLVREGVPAALPAAGELAAYRTVQEGLTNVVKHSGADAASEVTLAWDAGGLTVTVHDDGGDRSRRRPLASGGHGLSGLRERVRLAGGTLEAGPSGTGFVLSARLPR